MLPNNYTSSIQVRNTPKYQVCPVSDLKIANSGSKQTQQGQNCIPLALSLTLVSDVALLGMWVWVSGLFGNVSLSWQDPVPLSPTCCSWVSVKRLATPPPQLSCAGNLWILDVPVPLREKEMGVSEQMCPEEQDPPLATHPPLAVPFFLPNPDWWETAEKQHLQLSSRSRLVQHHWLLNWLILLLLSSSANTVSNKLLAGQLILRFPSPD